MNAQPDQGAVLAAPIAKQSAIGAFFDTVLGVIMVTLLAAGLIALTLTWRSSDLEFLGDNEIKVTRATWWGLMETVTRLEVSPQGGWMVIGDDGVRVPLRNRAMRLED
ncbi:hypothetical protein E5843_06715 [Luteimonas yindakuii]|uniref:hypothetical protein n=1 Tax=Luteimonas yindakuii TaxID=2565782 RepID=UPI0010A537D2|nr:hypothetical protein [Luteimonas yindakuii]QCO67539.1 hypothetical protein E5843_06715 [Luteimonas yindakuii]